MKNTSNELSKFRIRCTVALFFIAENEEFYYDPTTDEYFNETNKISRSQAMLWPDNFENIE
jgi:hypothetical protein